MAEPETLVLATYRIGDGNARTVLRSVFALTEASRREPGVISFGGYQSIEDPSVVLLVERYRNSQALSAHRSSEHFAQLVMQDIAPLLSSRIPLTFEVVRPT